MKIRQGGTWKDATPHVRVAGTWQEVQEAHIRAGGVWVKAWENVTPFHLTVSTNMNRIVVRTWAVNNGWDEDAPLVVTVASGVLIQSSTATAPMIIDGSFPNGVTLINNGIIRARGGNGGDGGNPTAHSIQDEFGPFHTCDAPPGLPGAAGNVALDVRSPCSIENNGSIIGGGGGGGGGGSAAATAHFSGCNLAAASGGSGGGGGQSNTLANGLGGARSLAGGVWGEQGQVGTAGNVGAAGTVSAAGAGGVRANTASLSQCGRSVSARATAGGNGGAHGAGGAAAPSNATASGPSLTDTGVGGAGGAAGPAVVGNSHITWITTGTRIGPIT